MKINIGNEIKIFLIYFVRDFMGVSIYSIIGGKLLL